MYYIEIEEANSDRGYYDISVYCTYRLKFKPFFDGKARLDIHSHYRGALPGKPCVRPYPKYARTDTRVCLCQNWVPAW